MNDYNKIFLIPLAAFLLIFAVLIFMSVASYDAFDPAWDYVGEASVKNSAGILGANLASFFLAVFGYASYLIAFLLLNLSVKISIFWGSTFFSPTQVASGREEDKRFNIFYVKVIYGLLAIIFACGLLSYADAYYTIPTEYVLNSHGGYIGYLLHSSLVNITGEYIYFFAFMLLSMAFFIFSVTYNFSLWYRNIIRLARYSKWLSYWFAYGSYRLYCFVMALFRDNDAVVDSINTGKSNINSDKINPLKKHNIITSPSVSKPANNFQESFDILMSQDFQLPALSLLNLNNDAKSKRPSNDSIAANAEQLEKVLEDFGIQGRIIEVEPGPVVTRYALEPAPGIKSSRVIGLADDIARSMTAISARISVISGQNAIGIELPNSYRETVYFKELLISNEYQKSKAVLPLALGKDIAGKAIVIDLAKTPHLLVAGTTGSGKSVGLNAMILSLLYRYSPQECKLIMIDPKMLELSVYDNIPHLLTPVVTEAHKAIVALKWIVKEMENRYRLMSNLSVRNITGYNEKIVAANKKGQILTRKMQTGYASDTGDPIFEEVPIEMTKMPYIVLVVDEMADLMIVAGKEIESYIQRLAQMARAAGIHVILATQRPSVDVITGIIKANFPSRISYQVTSKIDSRTILGEQGAEQLLGMGDLLYMASGSKITRIHGPFVSDEEVQKVTDYLRSQGNPEYIQDVTTGDNEQMFANDTSGDFGFGGDGSNSGKDSLYDQAVSVVIRDNKVSTSYVQRALKIGYNRAANIIEQMEEEGIISEPDHVGRRKILVK